MPMNRRESIEAVLDSVAVGIVSSASLEHLAEVSLQTWGKAFRNKRFYTMNSTSLFTNDDVRNLAVNVFESHDNVSLLVHPNAERLKKVGKPCIRVIRKLSSAQMPMISCYAVCTLP